MGIFLFTGKPPEFQVDVSINVCHRRNVFESFFTQLMQYIEATIDEAINTAVEKKRHPVCHIDPSILQKLTYPDYYRILWRRMLIPYVIERLERRYGDTISTTHLASDP